jgi:hypothetical protein
MPEDAVRSPVLGQFHDGARQIAVELLQLASKRANREKASAVDPANPARILSL